MGGGGGWGVGGGVGVGVGVWVWVWVWVWVGGLFAGFGGGIGGVVEVPAEDFAVEDDGSNGGLGDGAEGFGEFGEARGDVFAVAGVDADAVGLGGVSAVKLGAHAVVFVFEEGLDGGVGGRGWRVQGFWGFWGFGGFGGSWGSGGGGVGVFVWGGGGGGVGGVGVGEGFGVVGVGGWIGVGQVGGGFFGGLAGLCGFWGFFGFGGEASDGFFGGFNGAGEHEAEGVEEAHAGVGEGSGEGAADGPGEVGFEHDGVADGADFDGVGGVVGGGGLGDGFFDEALFDADAHVAEHEFEEVFGFDGGGLAEEVFDEAGTDGGGSGDGDGVEGGADLGEGEGGLGGCGAGGREEEVEGGGAEVAVAAVGGGELGVGGSADGAEGFGEEGSAGVEFAGVGFGEGLAGEEEGEEAGVVERLRGGVGLGGEAGEGLGDGGAFFEAAAFLGELVCEAGDFDVAGHGFGCPLKKGIYFVQPGVGLCILWHQVRNLLRGLPMWLYRVISSLALVLLYLGECRAQGFKNPGPPDVVSDQEQYVSYWTTEANWHSELQLRNNSPSVDLIVTPSLRSADGTETKLAAVTLAARHPVHLEK